MQNFTDATSLAKKDCKGFPSILQQGGFTHIRIYYGGKGNIPKNWPQNFSARALQFHGQIFQPLPEEKFGQTGSMQTKTFVCASLDTDQNMKASCSCFTRAGNSNLDTQRVYRDEPPMAQKARVGLHVQVRARSCRQVFIFHTCPALNPDQDTQTNFDFSRASGPRSKTLCMSKSEPRPGHADQFWFSTGARAPLKNPLHVQV